MTSTKPKWLVVQCAALGWNLLDPETPELGGMRFSPLTPVSPGVTCSAQASFRTAEPASGHGMIANGLYHRLLRRPLFWEQSSSQVACPRIWDSFRQQGGTVGMMFWQQSLGEDVDLVVSPRPIHKHSGGMIQDCHTYPDDLYDRLCAKVGRSFNLMHYWGPLASKKSSDWIVAATKAVLDMDDVCPDILLSYLPHLDYDTQRHGPDHPKAALALQQSDAYLRELREASEAKGYQLLVWGDYAMHNVSGPAIFPNRALRDAGLLGVRHIKGMAYPNLFAAKAFAMTDHELAHIYIPDADDIEPTLELLAGLDGVNRVFRRSELPDLDHPNSGELIAFATPGRWFAYPWWSDPKEAPDFATHVDIHNKPGFDVCELFFGRFPWQVSQDTGKVGGCHGAPGPDSRTAWACTDPDFTPGEIPDLLDLARTLKSKL
ncbi:MAG: alkaline phosphatase family protein [Kiritimatiellae bacterium]|jgi:predicted AlkP superfamily pyrophosphatase or phosphodiesterase|nr:alkaline phosphatase family protein [Kiritimatiellia bacterium]